MTLGYLRYPHVHADEIVFVADNDIWLAPLSGGRAQRLTTDGAPCRTPYFSPSGASIAWTSFAAGGPDVYVLDRANGEVARLTWFGAPSCAVAGWLDEEHVLVASAAHRGLNWLTWLHSVSADGRLRRLPLGPAMGVAYGPGGQVAVNSPNGRDSAMWKRYRGGAASRLWLDASGRGEWQIALPDEPAGKYSPGWFGDRLFFSSDLGAGQAGITEPAAQAQLYSVDAVGGELQQHTHHTAELGFVRNPTTDGTTIVYHARGRLYAMAGLAAEPHQIEIDLGIGAPRPELLDASERLRTVLPDHGGDGSLLEWRGAAYYLTHRAGPARALSALPGVRIREPQILGRTGKGIWVTDAEGEDALEIMPLDALADPQRIAACKLGRVLHLKADTAGERVAAISHDGTVRVITLAGKITAVGCSTEGEATGLAWSPDGRYLVWRAAVAQEGAVGKLVCVDTENTPAGAGAHVGTTKPVAVDLTAGTFNDFDPAFTSDGKFLVLLSSRTFEPHYDEHSFGLAFGQSVRPWLIPLRADQPAPFGISVDGWRLSELDDDKDKDKDDENSGKAKAKVKPVPRCEIDLAGFEERMVAFPVPSDGYRDLRVVKDGVAWIRERGGRGVLGAARAGVSGEPEFDVLERYGFSTRKTEELVGKVESFEVSGDGERLVVRIKDDVTVVPADRKLDEDDDPARVKVDLSRLRREILPRDEWRQMFDENGRIMAQHYWRADMDGTDWAAVLQRYRPLIEVLHTADDLVDVLWETVGELNTSHAYVMPPVDADLLARKSGMLGADLTHNAKGETVLARIIPGETSDPKAWSPLRAAGVAAKDGDVVLAVDGTPVADAPALGALLAGASGKPVELTLRTGLDAPRRVAVVPLAEEETLRYHDWVASRAAYVDQFSKGRLGYVHVPDMMGSGWAQLHRQIERATRRDGVILDVRFNRGGHTSQLVIERLSRTVQGWDFARHYDSPASYPSHAVRGPVVLVCNQWAGSDGDIVNAVAQCRGLGPVVGERTWGGVIGIDSRFDLVDGTVVTQPRYASWFNLQGWGIENHGVDPDVEVILTPADWEAKADIQLDVAIAVALARLQEQPASVAPELPPARFS